MKRCFFGFLAISMLFAFIGCKDDSASLIPSSAVDIAFMVEGENGTWDNGDKPGTWDFTISDDLLGDRPLHAYLNFYYSSDPSSNNTPGDGVYTVGSEGDTTEDGDVYVEIHTPDYVFYAQSGTLTISNSDLTGDGNYTLSLSGIFAQYELNDPPPPVYVSSTTIYGTVDVISVGEFD